MRSIHAGASRGIEASEIKLCLPLPLFSLLLILFILIGAVPGYASSETTSSPAAEQTATTISAEEEAEYTQNLAAYRSRPEIRIRHFPLFGISAQEMRSYHWLVRGMIYMLYTIIGLVCIYLIRHYWFTLNRLFGKQRHPYLDLNVAEWPPVTILIPAHNEEEVIGEILTALINVDYPSEQMTIIPINDRSGDKTGEILDDFASRYPRIQPVHRTGGTQGKGAVLKEVTETLETEINLVFDADYIPGRGLIKQLVAPFFDPEIGAVMGRVVPANVDDNLLTRMLDLERAGGYQVDQQARMNMHLVPQYGGTVGGVRRSALLSVGGWSEHSLADDTDATYRLLLGGWKVAYQNRSECYEQVPDNWPTRIRQISRWAQGHNQTMLRYSGALLRSRHTSFFEKLDGLLLLGVYMMSPVMLLGWILAITLWFMGINKPGLIIILAVTSYSTLGNFATFFEVAAAAHLDGSRERIRLMPFILLGFLASLFAVTRISLKQLLPLQSSKGVVWHKTEHKRRSG
ncbi:MAG: glycosyltransferase family 2 protein [bacterium]|nr:glycosyltransferase family 2 protein [bacterium]